MVQIDIDIPQNCAMCPLLVTAGFDAYCKINGVTVEPETLATGRLKDCPMQDVQPIKHAHWIDEELELGEDFCLYKCSNCGEEFQLMDGTPNDNDYGYCPHCGAKMDDVKHE